MKVSMSDLLGTTDSLMSKINDLPCHPKNKLLLYHRFLLSKLSWNLTIADISKTWIIDNLDSIVSKYIRQWLELPISATLSSLIINKSKYGISLILPSIKFIQCQTTIRNTLKSSPNNDIKDLWKDTSYHTNIQYDQYRNTKHALKSIQTNHENRINHELCHRASSFHLYLNIHSHAPPLYGLRFRNVYPKIYSILLLNT